jgi:hypothetical protein
MENKTARELVASRDEAKIVEEWYEDGIKVMIVSLHSYFTAYFGLPLDHPLAGFSYDDIPLNVHGGLTFGNVGSEKGPLPKDLFMYGWDYAHLGDYSYFDFNLAREFLGDEGGDHDWTLGEVKKEAKDALYDFKQLVKLAERIKSK